MAQADQEDAAAVMQTGLQYCCIRQVQRHIRQFHALGIPAAQVVEEINRLQAVIEHLLMVGLDCVNPRLPDIILVRGEFSQDAGLVRRIQLFLTGSQSAQGCFTVAVADVLLPCRVQGKFFSRVLPQAFVQVIAPAASLAYQEVIRQGLNLGGVCVGDLHRCCFGKTAVEDPQAGKEFLFGRFQQAPGMINRGAQAAVPGWHVDQFGGEGIHGAAQVGSPALASVFSLAAQSTERSVVVSSVPRPRTGPQVRPPAVAGAFYPGDPGQLARMIDGLLADGDVQPADWPGVLVPHAGLIYSGRLAAQTLRRVRIPPTVIVIAPKHTRQGVDCAVAPHEIWSLPGAQMASDPGLARRLADEVPGLQLDAGAHQQEHSIEVQLPILARLAPQSRVVGITLGAGDWERCRALATGLAQVLRSLQPRPLLVISSDMNHYASDDENRRLDEIALQAVETLDPAAVYDTVVARHNISMCGVRPAIVVMETLRQLDLLGRCVRVGYETSAAVSRDTSRVVGYAGLLFGTAS